MGMRDTTASVDATVGALVLKEAATGEREEETVGPLLLLEVVVVALAA